jgi:uncharacterized protein
MSVASLHPTELEHAQGALATHPEASQELLAKAIERGAELLPGQGPITVFIHHNTLHAFEEHPFFEGVERGSEVFGCQPYLPEERYHQEMARGRITSDDLIAALSDELGEQADRLLGFLGTRLHFRLAMLRYPLQSCPPAELRWFIAETDALRRFRNDLPDRLRQEFIRATRRWTLHAFGHLAADCTRTPDTSNTHALVADLLAHYGRESMERWSEATWESFGLQALWRICREGVHRVKTRPRQHKPPLRHRDVLLEATGEDIDELVNGVLIRFCAAYLDQGLARWSLPGREAGFLAAFCQLYGGAGGTPDAWLRPLRQELATVCRTSATPLALIEQSLAALGVPPKEYGEFIQESLLTLRGWAGMIRQVELRSDRVARPIAAGSLIEYLAVRLILERLALAHVARTSLECRGSLADLRRLAARTTSGHERGDLEHRAFQAFQLAQALGWSPRALAAFQQHDWEALVGEIDTFNSIARRRVFQAAYERRHRIQALDAIAVHARRAPASDPEPAFQVACCLDEREESFRRHVEEVEPAAETFGAAGFYNVAMYYRGATDAHFVPLCPVVIRPQHWVAEAVDDRVIQWGDRIKALRRAWGRAAHGVHVSSRGLAAGAVVATGIGAVASIPLVARVLFPRLTASFRRRLGELIQLATKTHLQLERHDATPGPSSEGIGFTLAEITDISERLLRDMGLTSRFARVVVILGHGSNSLNNPHNSAYNCGACGGNCGGPNARAISQMLNNPRVRIGLRERGIHVPEETQFIGAWHDTCNDAVTYFDLWDVEGATGEAVRRVKKALEEACRRNAHERSRRFVSAPLHLTPAQAKRHVEARAEDLAQVRPELGHATNALCIVARRSRTNGLFLDRRAFLTSYDPTQDDGDYSTLTRLLSAAVPVCAGINLEYYFSHVDNAGYGCGTKLPHNVTSLLGVMDGHASDLRTGLPFQMIEIHEPVRLLFVIENTPAAVLRIMERNPSIGLLFKNHWVQVATLDPHSAHLDLLVGDRFIPYLPQTQDLPRAASSIQWYRGLREHLPLATIGT